MASPSSLVQVGLVGWVEHTVSVQVMMALMTWPGVGVLPAQDVIMRPAIARTRDSCLIIGKSLSVGGLPARDQVGSRVFMRAEDIGSCDRLPRCISGLTRLVFGDHGSRPPEFPMVDVEHRHDVGLREPRGQPIDPFPLVMGS